MDAPQILREHAYFMDHRGFIYLVRGPHHQPGRIKATLVYVPVAFQAHKFHPKTGTYYTKLIDELGGVFCHRNAPEMLYTDPITQDTFIGIPREQVQEYVDPVEQLGRIKAAFASGHPLHSVLHTLASLGIAEMDIGVYGSHLVGLTADDSDIDMMIYGTENFRRWEHGAAHAFGDKLTSRGEGRGLYRDLVTNYPFSFREARATWNQRFNPYMLTVGNASFGIRFAFSPAEVPQAESYSPIGEILCAGEVVNVDNSAFCPCVYCVAVDKLWGERTVPSLIRAVSYRFNYRNLFALGDRVIVYGMQVASPLGDLITLDRHDYFVADETVKMPVALV